MMGNEMGHPVASEKEKRLDSILGGFDRVAVAFSGGTDSTYLLYRALTVLGRGNVLAVTVSTELTGQAAVEGAVSLAEKLGAEHLVLNLNILSLPAIEKNERNRCYYCKKTIYVKMLAAIAERGRHVLLDGSHSGDRFEERPGMLALDELNIRRPLQEAALDKQEIRLLSRDSGLPTWDKPAEACFASRFPYGHSLTADEIRKVAEAEAFLRRIGLVNEMRVRCHGQLARIEVNITGFQIVLSRRSDIVSYFRNLGYFYVTLDLEGFSPGSMDRQ
ncbi:MAG: ATP-dependent sacrificial sulfur transferase LarE [Bacillota bacterium]|nr:ATP-dependent sacrificial sulfur transferase LarE [Bacillota bacterium]